MTADHQSRAFANQANRHRKHALDLIDDSDLLADESLNAYVLLSISYELAALRRVLEGGAE